VNQQRLQCQWDILLLAASMILIHAFAQKLPGPEV
jgi:hypothetical protein